MKSAIPRGQILLFSMVLMMFLFMGAGTLLSFSFERTLTEQRLSKIEDARETAEAGIERAVYEANAAGNAYTGSTESIGNGKAVISVVTNPDGTKSITSVGTVQDQTVTAKATISAAPTTQAASFYYALQVGSGGINFKNNAKVVGNVVADGSLTGSNGASISQTASVSGLGHSMSDLTIGLDANVDTLTNCIVGQDAKTLKISGSTIGRDGYAASITGSTIGRNAYANSIKTTSVGGTKYPGNGINPPASIPLPLTDAEMDAWQIDAAAGGTISSYQLGNNTSASLGPVKINGDLTINNGSTLTITGTIWVTGTITAYNGSTITLDPGYATTSGIMIASDPNNPTTNGKILLENNVAVTGSGQTNSNILLISRLQGTGVTAIDASNNSSSMTLYAANGLVQIHNNFIINSVTAYQLQLDNNAEVVYNNGLASSQFSAGPGGAWQLLSGSVEIR